MSNNSDKSNVSGGRNADDNSKYRLYYGSNMDFIELEDDVDEPAPSLCKGLKMPGRTVTTGNTNVQDVSSMMNNMKIGRNVDPSYQNMDHTDVTFEHSESSDSDEYDEYCVNESDYEDKYDAIDYDVDEDDEFESGMSMSCSDGNEYECENYVVDCDEEDFESFSEPEDNITLHCELCRADTSGYGPIGACAAEHVTKSMLQKYCEATDKRTSRDYEEVINERENDLLFLLNCSFGNIYAPHIDAFYGTEFFKAEDFEILTDLSIGFINREGQRVYSHGMYMPSKYYDERTGAQALIREEHEGIVFYALRFSDGSHYLVSRESRGVKFIPCNHLAEEKYIKKDNVLYAKTSHTIIRDDDTVHVHAFSEISDGKPKNILVSVGTVEIQYDNDVDSLSYIVDKYEVINCKEVENDNKFSKWIPKFMRDKKYEIDGSIVEFPADKSQNPKSMTARQFSEIIGSSIRGKELNVDNIVACMRAKRCWPNFNCLTRSLLAMGFSLIEGNWVSRSPIIRREVCSRARGFLNPCNCDSRIIRAPLRCPTQHERVQKDRKYFVGVYLDFKDHYKKT